MNRLNIIPVKPLVILLLIIFALVCYSSQNKKSVTVDEFSHFPSGIYILLSMDWRMDHESPPLIKCLPAITSILTQPKLDPGLFKKSPNPWSLGYYFMYANQINYQKIFEYGRCIIIFLGCLLGWFLFKFGTDVYGPRGGLLVLFLYVFNPNIIAHSQLTTIDIGASLTVLLSVYSFWRFLKRRDMPSVFLAGLCLGLAQLSKFTALLLYPIFIIIILVVSLREIFSDEDEKANSNYRFILRNTWHLAVIFFVSLVVINAGYFFHGTMIPVEKYHFLSISLKRISAPLWGGTLVPLPRDYLMGFDSQMAISEGHNPFYASYLMGEYSTNGWWYYYIVASLVKNPIALIGIVFAGMAAWITQKQNSVDLETSLCIWLPPLVYFLYFSFFVHIQIGIRYLLPVFPFIFLGAGILVKSEFLDKKAWKFLLFSLLLVYGVNCAIAFPNYLSYFNAVAGDSENNSYWLNDSNLDWGQDLPGLKDYLTRNKIEKINMGYFGRVDPGIYGIKYELAKKIPEPGKYAISANFITGKPYYILDPKSKKLVYTGFSYFKAYNHYKPVKIINNSIYIFDINK